MSLTILYYERDMKQRSDTRKIRIKESQSKVETCNNKIKLAHTVSKSHSVITDWLFIGILILSCHMKEEKKKASGSHAN